MSQFANSRSNVLDDSERAESARRCIQITADAEVTEEMSPTDRDFFLAQVEKARAVRYSPSERQLQWLRDIKDRYAL